MPRIELALLLAMGCACEGSAPGEIADGGQLAPRRAGRGGLAAALKGKTARLSVDWVTEAAGNSIFEIAPRGGGILAIGETRAQSFSLAGELTEDHETDFLTVAPIDPEQDIDLSGRWAYRGAEVFGTVVADGFLASSTMYSIPWAVSLWSHALLATGAGGAEEIHTVDQDRFRAYIRRFDQGELILDEEIDLGSEPPLLFDGLEGEGGDHLYCGGRYKGTVMVLEADTLATRVLELFPGPLGTKCEIVRLENSWLVLYSVGVPESSLAGVRVVELDLGATEVLRGPVDWPALDYNWPHDFGVVGDTLVAIAMSHLPPYQLYLYAYRLADLQALPPIRVPIEDDFSDGSDEIAIADGSIFLTYHRWGWGSFVARLTLMVPVDP